jgi:hypothetical protein
MMLSPRSTLLDCIAIALLVAATFGAPGASGAAEAASARAEEPHDFFGVVGKSLAGDVYDPARWHELSLGSFFTDGWDEAWASGPNGEGGAPRQGWLNAADGVFYRLFLFTFNWAHQDNDSYVAGLTGYTPLNKRFQFRFDIPFFVSQPTGFGRETGFGDFQVTANLAAGYYFTPHDLLPIGDLVWYVSTNLDQDTDGEEILGVREPNVTTLTFTPGFRTHLGANFYLLGGVEVPATNPKPFDYQVLAALMKVW